MCEIMIEGGNLIDKFHFIMNLNMSGIIGVKLEVLVTFYILKVCIQISKVSWR